MPNGSPLPPPPAPHSTLGRRLPNPPASSATVLPPAFLPPVPKCSNGSLGPQDPRLPSDGPDWGEAPTRMLFSGAPCCHLFPIQLFLQLSHQFRQHFFRIPLHRAPRLRTLRRHFTLLSTIVMLLQGRSP